WPEPSHTRQTWRTAAECIDWSIPCPSIFDRKKPLVTATLRRIASGIVRHVIDCEPFVVPSSALPASSDNSAISTAFIAKHYGGVVGHNLFRPIGTITAIDHHALVVASTDPTRHHADSVAAFLISYYGQSRGGESITLPMPTVVTKDRHGLVTARINGETRVITDIGMRMLTPRELATAQGFPESYVLTGTKTQQVARIGNSVCPPVAAAVVTAQLGDRPAERNAA
ncbi:MAG TPA: DNA cytosine methyltransferase, partial [Candidatus Ozemobacteraceae bacterium]|nr:DNA cytosine methyltransferase [Candidatus Ozemobacteraceae bacterium]